MTESGGASDRADARSLLHANGLLGASPDAPLERIARLAARALQARAAQISLLDGERLVPAAGFGSASLREACAALQRAHGPPAGERVLAIADAREDARCATAVARSLRIGGYAAAPLVRSDGSRLGWFAVLDARRREWSRAELKLLGDARSAALALIESRLETLSRRDAEEELRVQKAHLEYLLESAPEAVALLDNEHRVLRVNREFTRMFGYSASEASGRFIDELVVPEKHRQEAARITEQVRDGATVSKDTVRRRKDGSELHVSVLGTPIRLRRSQIAIYAIYRDITERRGAQESLERSEQRYRELFENANDIVYTHDLAGNFISVNRMGERITGYAREEALQRNIVELVAPEHRKRAREMLRAQRAAPQGASTTYEFEILTRDGQRVPLEVSTRVLVENGVAVGVQGIGRDISERKHAEARLAVAEAHYRRLVETSPYAIYALDAEGRFTEINAAAAQILGCAAAKLLGRPFTDVIAPEDRAAVLRAFRNRVAARLPDGDIETRIVRPGGERRQIEIRSTAIYADGQVIGMHGVARDITEERARDAQLRRAERLASLGTLLGGVAHELNNPLTSIKSFAQLLLMEEQLRENREALEIIYDEADRAARIVADLRTVARQTQEQEAQRSAVDLNDVVRDVLERYRAALGEHGIEVHEDLATELPAVWADAAKLKQMVLNLIENAVRAVRTAGERRIGVRTRAHPRGATLAVIDAGPGIAREHLDRIFDPFWTTAPPGEGKGLGLSVVHGIVTEHGGRIRVETEPGCGATFTVELPWFSQDPAREPVESPEPLPGRAMTPLRILLVEDEAPIRHSLARFLARRGHHVDEAAEGGAALRQLEIGAPYDIVISDLRMPGLDGEALFANLRARDTELARRVVFVTGDATSSEVERFLAAAAVPVVLKPFGLGEIAELVERYCGELGDRRESAE